LQLVVRRQPEWRVLPTVVVDEDKTQGKVLWANATALAAGVLPGHSYALALSLIAGLRACEVSGLEIQAATKEIQTLLWRFSPSVEVGEETGVFWLDATGLGRLFASLETWAHALRQQLLALGFNANVIVGFSRFGTYALARAGWEQPVFGSEAEERDCVARVPLACLDIEADFRDVLAKLGVHTIEALSRLPVTGLLTRFGKNAERLHSLAAGEFAALEPATWLAPLHESALFDDAETDTTRLLFVIKRLLDALLAKLALRGEALASLGLSFKIDRKRGLLEPEALRPALPTLDVLQLMDLVRLKMETLSLEGGVVEVELDAQGLPTSAEQLQVFAEQPRRDLAAAKRAIARLRAEFGEGVVVRAVLCAGHLPEACFAWQPVEELQLPAAQTRTFSQPMTPQPVTLPPLTRGVRTLPVGESVVESLARRPLVRRIFARPELLSAPARQLRNDGWLIRGAQHGPVTHASEPCVVAGGWWLREVHREYQFVLTGRGELLWVYQDKRRRRWLLHAEVQ
jgi:protein ImuB